MNKRRFGLLFAVIVFLTGYFLGQHFVRRERQRGEEKIASAAFLEGVTGIFSSEPTEIQELRKQEIILKEEGHIEYYFQQLNDEEKRAYRQILSGVRNLKESFFLTIADEKELDRTYHAVLKDHPELFWIHNKEEVYRTTYGDSAYCLFAPNYSYTASEIAEIQAAIEKVYQELSWNIPGNTDTYETIKMVYTYITDETEYAFSDQDQNIAGVFFEHKAVCAGYARAVQYLLERMGIYCIYVDGEVRDRPDGHAWNIVQINGEYYYVDTTNADQPEFLQGNAAALAEHKTTVLDYLCPFPQEYEKNYFASEEFEVPACTATDKNFYVINQGCFDTYDRQTLYDYCCMRIDNNAAVVRFKFSNQEAMDAAYEEWIKQEAVQDVAQYYMSVHDLRSVEYHYGILEEFKSIYLIF